MTENHDVLKDSISFDLLKPSPLLLVISGPSGVGKDSVVRQLLERDPELRFVVTATSRAPRAGEAHGVDYYFVSKEEFERMIAAEELLEYANVYDQYKGVPKSQVREAIRSGHDVIMRLDVQGAKKIRSLCPQATLIFLAPTNKEEWYLRLENRKTETEDSLRLRLETVKNELEYLPEFDYVVYNPENCLEQAVDKIQAIIAVEHLRVQPGKITL